MRGEKEYLVMDDREYSIKKMLPPDVSEEERRELFDRLIEKYHLKDEPEK